MDKMTNEELVESVIGIAESFYLDAPDDCADAQKSLAEIKRYKTELLSRLARAQELEKEVERLTERVDFARHNKNLMDWTEGARAIQALEKIHYISPETEECVDCMKIIAGWREYE